MAYDAHILAVTAGACTSIAFWLFFSTLDSSNSGRRTVKPVEGNVGGGCCLLASDATGL